ncbi:hypothetical protein CKAH01_01110 [Colletotrichum kahawae]|uniref:Uncharacterized protein n=1 Tax=Colletotrichum kahawae TaxID=34407 RepID=A0AAE0D6S2_COLKA|nr:hypothetical protein CKAH01_01110 [Colletotrichum kahawae]
MWKASRGQHIFAAQTTTITTGHHLQAAWPPGASDPPREAGPASVLACSCSLLCRASLVSFAGCSLKLVDSFMSRSSHVNGQAPSGRSPSPRWLSRYNRGGQSGSLPSGPPSPVQPSRTITNGWRLCVTFLARFLATKTPQDAFDKTLSTDGILREWEKLSRSRRLRKSVWHDTRRMAKPAEKPPSPLSVPQSGSRRRPARVICNMRIASTSMMSPAAFGVRESVPAVSISATCHWILISAVTNTADHRDSLRAITIFWSPPFVPAKRKDGQYCWLSKPEQSGPGWLCFNSSSMARKGSWGSGGPLGWAPVLMRL